MGSDGTSYDGGGVSSTDIQTTVSLSLVEAVGGPRCRAGGKRRSTVRDFRGSRYGRDRRWTPAWQGNGTNRGRTRLNSPRSEPLAAGPTRRPALVKFGIEFVDCASTARVKRQIPGTPGLPPTRQRGEQGRHLWRVKIKILR